jgi:hypothetical protein
MVARQIFWLPEKDGSVCIFCCLAVAFNPQDEFLPVGFEVLTAVVLKSIIFWDMTLCSP